MKKRWLSLALAALMVAGTMMAGGCGSKSADGGDNTFSYWLIKTDGDGIYYNDYEDHPAVQWLRKQTWDPETHTRAEDGEGLSLDFTFQTPIAGAETDNFNTMVGTGEYTDIMDLAFCSNSKESLVEDGVLLDITEYVEKYMPDYVALLDAHPEWKAQVTSKDEDGNTRYLYLAGINDGPKDPWDGFNYRRDWVVKYAKPTDYVWDWDSTYVKENGHPAVTPLDAAKKAGNMEGWKVNPVTEFQVVNDGGEDPDNNYEDNVIFPSGTSDPLTISDWEWMLAAFDQAIDERGWADDSNAYGISVAYSGFFGLGDLVSSFGGGNGSFYLKDGKVSYSGTSENFKTYLECLNTWYKNGWMDSSFETRSGDLFYMINQSGFNQGKVGIWEGMVWDTGKMIRTTCMNEEDQKDAFVMGCQFPINDKYGTDEQKYKDPDCMYQTTPGPEGGIGITTKIEEKSEDAIAALFTYFNWKYTQEGAEFYSLGLSQAQYEEADLDPDIYKEYGFEDGLYHVEDREGVKTYVSHIDPGSSLNGNAFATGRMLEGLRLSVRGDVDYQIDNGESRTYQEARDAYGTFVSTGNVLDKYQSMMNDDESKLYNSINNSMNDYINQQVPKMIKEGLGEWNTYVEKVNSFEPEKICEIFQKYVDEAMGK